MSGCCMCLVAVCLVAAGAVRLERWDAGVLGIVADEDELAERLAWNQIAIR